MWSGQHRALDEINELLLMFFNWFARKRPFAIPIRPHVYSTDHSQCLWYIADFFRRRLILPKTSNTLQRGQALPERESLLFRAWATTRPPKYANQDLNAFEESATSIEDELDQEGDIEEELFWQDGDEGIWDEEGVLSWRDSDDTFGLAGLSI